MEFKRPESLIYPQIYKTFEVDGEEFCIQDLTESREAEALEFLTQYVIPEENFCKALQIHKNPIAMEIMLNRYREKFKSRLSLVCFKRETGELVGLNVLGVITKGESKGEIVSGLQHQILNKSL